MRKLKTILVAFTIASFAVQAFASEETEKLAQDYVKQSGVDEILLNYYATQLKNSLYQKLEDGKQKAIAEGNTIQPDCHKTIALDNLVEYYTKKYTDTNVLNTALVTEFSAFSSDELKELIQFYKRDENIVRDEMDKFATTDLGKKEEASFSSPAVQAALNKNSLQIGTKVAQALIARFKPNMDTESKEQAQKFISTCEQELATSN